MGEKVQPGQNRGAREAELEEIKNLAAAMYDPRHPVLTRSSKLHRPRGYTCGLGMCPNCMMRVEGVPNVRVCQHPSGSGLHVEKQNEVPILDSLGILSSLHRFIPPGFQYKLMYSSKTKRRIFYSVLKRVSGLGRMPEPRTLAKAAHKELSPDLLVVGAGAAGLAAARAAGKAESVLLVDSRLQLGGESATLWEKSSLGEVSEERDEIRRLAADVTNSSNVKLLLGTTVLGYYRLENLFLAVGNDALYEVRPKRTVLATGCHETLPLFAGNDSPRLVHGAAFQLLMDAGAKAPSTSFVVDLNGKGVLLAADMESKGIKVLGVSKPVPFTEQEADICRRHGLKMLPGTTVREAGPDGKVELEGSSELKTVRAEAIVVCGRYQPNYELAAQAGIGIAFSTGEEAPVLLDFTPPKFGVNAVLAGSVKGLTSTKECVEDGALSGSGGARAARVAMDISPDGYLKRAYAERGLDSFVCACEDVSVGELLKAIEEGYDTVEELKRYTGAVTGPCQGKQCALAVASILHMKKSKGAYLTTVRQPLSPTSFMNLAVGQKE